MKLGEYQTSAEYKDKKEKEWAKDNPPKIIEGSPLSAYELELESICYKIKSVSTLEGINILKNYISQLKSKMK
jgi:hypothetical protein